MSAKERIAFIDRAGFAAGDLPIPDFEHNWSEYPESDAADIVPRLFWATIAITHACPVDADAIAQLHKLTHIVITGPARVDADACAARGIEINHLPAADAPGVALVQLLETLVAAHPR